MKILLTLILTLACVFECLAAPDPRATELDWTSKEIQVTSAGDSVRIVLHTGGTAGQRLIQADLNVFGEDSYATLTYQVIQNFERSFRHMENFDVTWTIPKEKFETLRAHRKFYLLRRDDVFLHANEIKEIKSDWQIPQ